MSFCVFAACSVVGAANTGLGYIGSICFAQVMLYPPIMGMMTDFLEELQAKVTYSRARDSTAYHTVHYYSFYYYILTLVEYIIVQYNVVNICYIIV